MTVTIDHATTEKPAWNAYSRVTSDGPQALGVWDLELISPHGRVTRLRSMQGMRESSRELVRTMSRDWVRAAATPRSSCASPASSASAPTGRSIEKGRGTSSETRTRAAIERQILGRTAILGKTPLWFFAHYHHAYSNEFKGGTVSGCLLSRPSGRLSKC